MLHSKDLITIEEAFKNIDSIRISKDNTKKFIMVLNLNIKMMMTII